jgi:putative hemolysin
MNSVLYTAIPLLAILLCFSALFSGAETAFFSLNHLERDKLSRSARPRLRSFLERALESPGELLVTVLTGNMVVNLFFASIVDRVMAALLGREEWLASVGVGTVVLLIFGEMLPKNLAIRHPLEVVRVTGRPLHLLHAALKPVRAVLVAIESGVVAFLSRRVKEGADEKLAVIGSVLRTGLERGILHESEYSLLSTFVEFREKRASDVLIPRNWLRGIEASERLAKVTSDPEVLRRRDPIPVYEGGYDRIVGYLDLRDLFYRNVDPRSEVTVGSVARPVHATPESTRVFRLLREMIAKDAEVTVAVDEYGGTSGIVTYQHLIEDFLDVYFPSRTRGITAAGDGAFRVAGGVELEELEKAAGLDLESESRTVAGLVTERTGEIPAPGTKIAGPGWRLEIIRATRSRIIEVEVRKEP